MAPWMRRPGTENPHPWPQKAFGSKVVLDGVDLDVMPGTSMVVIGGSGTGKSVLIKSILGLVEPDAGSIEIDGQDVLRMGRRQRDQVNRHIGMLFKAGRCSTACRYGRTWRSACWRRRQCRAPPPGSERARCWAGGVGAERGRPFALGALGRDAEAGGAGAGDRRPA